MRSAHWVALLIMGWVASRATAQTPVTGEADLQRCIVAANESQEDRDDGHLREARRKMVLCASDACPANLRRDCREWLADVEARLPTLVVRVVDEGEADRTDASVRLDGAAIPLDGRAVPVDPGPHVLEIEAEGYAPIHQTLLAAEREIARIVRIRLQPTAAKAAPAVTSPDNAPVLLSTAPPETTFQVPTGAWILGGIGVAALGSFTYFGLSASGEHDELAERCGRLCSDDDTRSGRTQALVADISLGVGLAALAGGVVWTLLAGPRSERARVQHPGLQMGGALTPHHVTGSLQGRF